MKKIVLLTAIIALLAVPGAFATITLSSVTKTTGFNANATIHDTVVGAKHWRYSTSTLSTFPIFATYVTGWFSGSFTGSLTNGITVVDSVLMYVKVEYYYDSASTTHYMSNVVKIGRKPKLTIVATSGVTTMHFSVGGDPGNMPATVTCTTYTTSALWSCTGCTFLPWFMRVDSGTSVVTTAETIPGTAPLAPFTPYYHVFIYTNSVGSDTVVRYALTLSPPTLATVSLFGLTYTSSTANIEMATNFFDYGTPRGVMYWKIAGSPSWTDSLVYTGYSVMTGNQNHTYGLTGLFGGLTYVFGYKAYGHFGPISFIDSFTTASPPPVFNLATIAAYYDSTSVQVVSHEFYGNISLAHYANYTVDFCQGVMSNVVDWHAHTYMYGSGMTDEYFTPTVSGPYWVHIYGADNDGHYLDGGYTLINVTLPVVVTPLPVIELFQLDSLTYTFGALPQYMYRVTGADVVKINGVIVPASDTMSFMVPVLASDTLRLTATNSAGSVDSVLHIIVLDPSSVKDVPTIDMFTAYPNPTANAITIKCDAWRGKTYFVRNMLGQTIAQFPATSSETTFSCHSLPAGMLAIYNGEQVINFIKQ
jgi:hypothetical protein